MARQFRGVNSEHHSCVTFLAEQASTSLGQITKLLQRLVPGGLPEWSLTETIERGLRSENPAVQKLAADLAVRRPHDALPVAPLLNEYLRKTGHAK